MYVLSTLIFLKTLTRPWQYLLRWLIDGPNVIKFYVPGFSFVPIAAEDKVFYLSPNLAQYNALGSPVVTIPVSKVEWKQALD